MTERRFHIQRWSLVITAVAGFILINGSDFGACTGEAEELSCVIGDTLVSDRTALFLAYTPLLFGPLAYLVAGLTPVWRQPIGLGGQIVTAVAALAMAGSGFAVLAWGAGGAALAALLVAAAGFYMAIQSYRTRPPPQP